MKGRFPLKAIVDGLSDPGTFFSEVTSLMPGISVSRLLGQEDGRIEIETNEGRMTRTNVIVKRDEAEVIVEFDEKYHAGKFITAQSHHLHRFERISDGTDCHILITDVKAPGLLGFMYRLFGAKNIGSALLKSYGKYGAAHS